MGGQSLSIGGCRAVALPVSRHGWATPRLAPVEHQVAFRPLRRATSATDAPARNVSSTIRRFSSRDQERRERLTAPASITTRVSTADELNDADPAVSSDNVHQP